MRIVLLATIFLFSNWKNPNDHWTAEKHRWYTLMYTANDENNRKDYIKFIDHGINSVHVFFSSSFKNKFSVYLHPSRQSLDSTWQKDWKTPSFKSECWMVASGVGHKMDIISPKLWDVQACEHLYSDKVKTQQLITHELVHIFHGQLNPSPDFSNTEGIDWFVEGLATFASGQCDSSRIAEVKKAISENKIPEKLEDYWTGKIRYGVSGSIVMYIDHKYGRKKLVALLPLQRKSEILATLNTGEEELIHGWKKFISPDL